MIAIKTQMKRMPEVCGNCPMYSNKSVTRIRGTWCNASKISRGGRSLRGEYITKGRPDWCPLVEV